MDTTLKTIRITVCQACLDAKGEECHTPGCAMWLHSVDLPIDPLLYDVLDRPQKFLAWAAEIFGPIALERRERLSRFVEEAIELASAESMPRSLLARIVERVYSRPQGETSKELGQAQACLETFAESIGMSADAEATREFDRVQAIPREEWTRRHEAKVAIGIAGRPPHSR